MAIPLNLTSSEPRCEAATPTPLRTGHVPALDGLRGIAILLVMFHHFQIIPPGKGIQSVLYNLSNFGPHGVDLFFVLSGFLITGILLDSRHDRHYFKNFYARRSLRIFPLYYAMLLISLFALPTIVHIAPVATAKLARFSTPRQDWPWYIFYCSNFLIAMTQAWRHPVLGVTWSLAIEEQFYFIWPVVIFFLDRKHIRRVALGLLATSALTRCILLGAGASWIQVYVLTPCRFDCIALGAYLAARLRSQDAGGLETLRAGSRILVCVGTPLLLVLYGAGILSYDQPATLMVGYPIVAFVSGAYLFQAVSYQESSVIGCLLRNGVLRFFGKYSYAIYFFHLPIRAALRDLIFLKPGVQQALGSPLLVQGIFYLAATLAVVPVALLSWNFFEKPFLTLKKRFA